MTLLKLVPAFRERPYDFENSSHDPTFRGRGQCREL